MTKETDWKSLCENIMIEFFKSKKNSNCVLELERLLLSSEEECVLSTIPFIVEFFSKVYSLRMLNTSSDIGKNAEYSSWLLSRYEDFISHLLGYVSHANSCIQVAALQALFGLLKLDSEYPSKNDKDNPNFPFDLFKSIVSCLASNVLNQYHLIKVFQEYTKFHDIKLYLLKSFQMLFQNTNEVSEVFLLNSLFLLCSMKFPKKFDDASAETFAYRSAKEQPFLLREKPFRKTFTSVWNCFLSCNLSVDILKKLLPIFNENVLPHLQNPCLFTDFLTNSYNNGGVLSLLSLKGLYLLMDSYNLEYPDFFVKLYALLNKDIINGKYSSEFFSLLDMFLSSTHLPAHLVSAFVKKMCRLSLISSTNNILKILCLISNLLANHPSLVTLIHQTDTQGFEKDPFCFDSTDPAKTNAMKSSLWEIQTLKSHINPDVSCKAKKLLDECPKFGSNIAEVSFTNSHLLYERIRKRKLTSFPLAVHRPVKMMKNC